MSSKTPATTNNSRPDTPNFGLHRLYPEPGDDDDDKHIDVIAIHGLDTQSPRQWIAWKKDGDPTSGHVHWLKDGHMLPEKIPNARIYTYDWNANVDTSVASDGMLGFADEFLDDLLIHKSKDNRDRPIIFIASCFGGLLLARALSRAAESHNENHHILLSIVGVVFLGTPFQGCNETFRTAAQQRALVATVAGKKGADDLVRYLEQDTSLDELVQTFREMADSDLFRFPITCFYETRDSDFSGLRKKLPPNLATLLTKDIGVLVNKHSATLPGKKAIALNVRHSMICRFASPDDRAFVKISYRLSALVENAESILMNRRQASDNYPANQLVPYEEFVGSDLTHPRFPERHPLRRHTEQHSQLTLRHHPSRPLLGPVNHQPPLISWNSDGHGIAAGDTRSQNLLVGRHGRSDLRSPDLLQDRGTQDIRSSTEFPSQFKSPERQGQSDCSGIANGIIVEAELQAVANESQVSSSNESGENLSACSLCKSATQQSTYFYQCQECISTKKSICLNCQKNAQDAGSCTLHRKQSSKRRLIKYGVHSKSLPWIDSKSTASDSRLVKALKKGDMDSLRSLIRGGYSVTEIDSAGYTPLHLCACLGLEDGADIILDANPPLDRLDKQLFTALGRAIQYKEYGVAKKLLEEGADPNIAQKLGATSLHLACMSGSSKSVQLLLGRMKSLDKPDNENRSALMISCIQQHWNVAKILLQRGVDPHAKLENIDGSHIGQLAATGKTEAVLFLLDEGADLEGKDNLGRTVLWRAAANGHGPLCRSLLDRGAKSSPTGSNATATLLGSAASTGNSSTVRELLFSGAIIDEQDSRNRTPLFRAAEAGHLGSCRELLEKKANPNAHYTRKFSIKGREQDPATILGIAVTRNHSKVVDLLLDNGADIEGKNWHQESPLQVAARKGHLNLVKRLCIKGAKVDSVDRYGQNAVSIAAKFGHLSVVRYLLQVAKAPGKPPPIVEDGKWKNFEFLERVPDETMEKILELLREYKHKSA